MVIDTELIFWIVAGVIGLIVAICVFKTPSNTVEITWGKRRDWAREEKRWGR